MLASLVRATCLVLTVEAALGAAAARAGDAQPPQAGTQPPQAGTQPPQAGAQELRLHLALSSRPHGTEAERDRIRALEEDLLGLLAERGAGTVARDRWEGGVCVIEIDAPDARRAWAAVEGAVRAFGPREGSLAVLRAGPKGAPEERIPLP
ncbi:MAG: hypothetical protein QM704_17925 [Anaeromyxobacteraceae bacterium]